MFNLKTHLITKFFILLLLLMVVLSLPKFCISHDSENPSFKYSRSANENVEKIRHRNNEPEHNNLDGHNGHSSAHFHAHDNHDVKKNINHADMTEIWLYSMGSTLFISAVPFLLLSIIPLDNSDDMRPRLKVLLAFASGGLLGDAFLHLIPHAAMPHYSQDNSHENHHGHSHRDSASHGHDHNKDTIIGLWVLGGIIAFLTVEKLVRLLKGNDNFNHGHSHGTAKKIPQEVKISNDKSGKKSNKKFIKDCKAKTEAVEISGYLNLAADFTHNFTDGLAIGASFLAGNSIGIVTTVTILLHEVPHEIGDFAILIKSGCSRRKAMLLQLVTALGALAGNVLALAGVGADADAAPWVLPFTAGGFIYIATVSVLPELLEESTKLGQSIKEICALLTGVFLMVLIANLE